jgi:hypothetical protein
VFDLLEECPSDIIIIIINIESLGLLSRVFWNSFALRWSCSLHLRLGRPVSHLSCTYYCTVSPVKREFSILFTCWGQFCSYFLISPTTLSWFNSFLTSTFLCLSRLVSPRSGLRKSTYAASSCFCSFLFITHSSLPYRSVAFPPLRNWETHYMVQDNLPLKHFNPAHTLTSYTCKIHFNILLTSTSLSHR